MQCMSHPTCPQRCEARCLFPLQHMCWARSGGAESAGAPARGTEVGQCSVTALCRGQLQHGLGVRDAAAGLHPLHGGRLVGDCVLSVSLGYTSLKLMCVFGDCFRYCTAFPQQMKLWKTYSRSHLKVYVPFSFYDCSTV